MTINKVFFTSNTPEWATPEWLFQELDREFGFETDVCATVRNSQCARWFTPEQDGLRQTWRGVCWMNPPYGRTIGAWMEKARRSAQDNGATVVCLVPARTDTQWWHDHVTQASEIRFLKGRLKFGESTISAPFPSAVVVFRPDRTEPTVRFGLEETHDD